MLFILEREKKKKKKLTSLWSIKLHYKFIQSTQNGDFMLTLDAEQTRLRSIPAVNQNIEQHSNLQSMLISNQLVWGSFQSIGALV